MDFIVVGAAGQAFKEHFSEPIKQIPGFQVVGLVDREIGAVPEVFDNVWAVREINQIPEEAVGPDVAVMVLTPDHYPVIEELSNMGFTRMMVEKPLVSRDEEVEKVRSLIEERSLCLYAIDFYIPKALPLFAVLGLLQESDPRFKFVRISRTDQDPSSLLGQIEGVSIQILEAGDFCLPDLAKRPWLERDPSIGGMLRDLGTHAFAPLVAARLLSPAAKIHDVKLSRLDKGRSSFVPLRNRLEVELYVNALLTEGKLPIHVVFGKIPFKGGMWTLEVRGEKGMFYAGLRSGQPAILISNNGESFIFSLSQSPYSIVLEEALMYFSGELPCFDGNVEAFCTSMAILQKMKPYYFA